MKIGGIIKNDFAAAPGVCVTVFVQGCPMNPHCPGCHNPELQDFNGGRELDINEVIDALKANGVHRDLCIMGGEPLCNENAMTTSYIAHQVRKVFPDIKIYIWTGYTYDDLYYMSANAYCALGKSDYLIDGPYKQEQRDITLFMRGSSNQRIINLKTKEDVTDDFERIAKHLPRKI